MTTILSSESANWLLPSDSTALKTTLPNYEESLPNRVNKEGISNYIKNRGTLCFGESATDGRRMSVSTSTLTQPINSRRDSISTPSPKVLGFEATRNYTRDRTSTPNLIYGNLDPPNPHHQLRVKREGRANYEKNQNSQMKSLLENYGKLPLPSQRIPHTQGEIATNLYYAHREGKMSSILSNYGKSAASPRRVPNVKGDAAEVNLQKGYGNAQILHHSIDYRPSTAEPNVKGIQAQLNYDMGRGRRVNQLFHEYGNLPQSARIQPKIKFGGVQNLVKGQGDAMRKTISQCPPSNRYRERAQSVQS